MAIPASRPGRKKKKHSSGGNLGLILGLSIGGGVLALALIGGTVACFLWPKPRPAVAEVTPPPSPPAVPATDKTPAGPPVLPPPPTAPAKQPTTALALPAGVPAPAPNKPVAPETATEVRQFKVNGGLRMAFSPGGKFVRVIGNDGGLHQVTVDLYATATGEAVDKLSVVNGRIFGGDAVRIGALAMSPDGQSALLSFDNGTILLWNKAHGEMRLEGHAGEVQALCFSADGHRGLSGGADRTIGLWDLDKGREVHFFDEVAAVTSMALAPDERRAVTGHPDGSLRLWDLPGRKELPPLGKHATQVNTLAFSPDGSRLLAMTADGNLHLWDMAEGNEVRTIPVPAPGAQCVAFSPDGQRLLTGGAMGAGQLRLWDLETGKELCNFQGHKNNVLAVVFAADGLSVFSGGADCTVQEWRLPASLPPPGDPLPIPNPAAANVVEDYFGPIQRLEEKNSDVKCVALSPDGKQVLTGSEPLGGRLWDVQTGKLLKSLLVPAPDPTVAQSPIVSVVFAPDGRRAYAVDQLSYVHVWDLAGGKEVAHYQGTQGVPFLCPDARHILFGGFNGFFLCDIANGQEKKHFGAAKEMPQPGRPPAQENVVAVSADGRRAITNIFMPGNQPPMVRVWDLTTGKEVQHVQGNPATGTLAFLPDNRQALACDKDGMIVVWETQTGKEVRRGQGPKEGVRYVAVAPDGKRALLGSHNGSLYLWDVENGVKLGRFRGQRGLASLAWSRDGKNAVTGGDDGTARIWVLPVPAAKKD
jgi:WD40 repeat protein